MDQEMFDVRKNEITEYIKTHRNKYYGKTDGIAKIRFLGDADEVFRTYRIDDYPARLDIVDIEDSGNAQYDANAEEYEDEKKLLEKNDCDIFIMFSEDDGLHTLHEVVSKDKEGNAKFPSWLPENNFTQNSVFDDFLKTFTLRQRYLDEAWDNAFIVFVIYGEEVLEDKPITEASRIILEETKTRITVPESYSVNLLKTKWDEYVHEHSDLYDEKFFAIITTKAIKETINWDWICTELNKSEIDPDEYENDDLALELNYGNCLQAGRHEKTNDEDWNLFCETIKEDGYSREMFVKLETRLAERNKTKSE